MSSLKLKTGSPEETQELGRSIGKLARPGDIYLFVGQLGAGKTCLTQGIAWGLDIHEYTLSPTFIIMREMHGRLPLYHMDFYRLDNIAEISDLGLDDYLYGRGVCVIEWAEKGFDVLPQEHLLVRITYLSDTERRIEMKPFGARYEEMQEQLKSCLPTLSKE
jgi:tRNA threonylcarbamoyladenosine biosynthesis protein TsaE